MKTFTKFLPLLFISLVGMVVMTGCKDDDEDKIISENSLPASARSFISQYFSSATVVTTQQDKDEYEVLLSDGTRIEFDIIGDWSDVEAAFGKVIPSGFYPSAIDNYVATNYPSVGINEISKEIGGYDVDLINGAELKFDYSGNFQGFDR